MQKQLLGAVLASTFLLVSCGNEENSVPQDNFGNSSSRGTEIDLQKGYFDVTCNIENFAQDKADGKFFWISIEDVKQAKHWPKFRVENENCFPNRISESQVKNSEKREKKILLLRIDQDRNQEFHQWISEGPKTGYPGLPIIQNEIFATKSILVH